MALPSLGEDESPTQRMRRLRREGRGVDVRLCLSQDCGGEGAIVVPAHATELIRHSAFFEELLLGRSDEPPKEICIFSDPAMGALLPAFDRDAESAADMAPYYREAGDADDESVLAGVMADVIDAIYGVHVRVVDYGPRQLVAYGLVARAWGVAASQDYMGRLVGIGYGGGFSINRIVAWLRVARLSRGCERAVSELTMRMARNFYAWAASQAILGSQECLQLPVTLCYDDVAHILIHLTRESVPEVLARDQFEFLLAWLKDTKEILTEDDLQALLENIRLGRVLEQSDVGVFGRYLPLAGGIDLLGLAWRVMRAASQRARRKRPRN